MKILSAEIRKSHAALNDIAATRSNMNISVFCRYPFFQFIFNNGRMYQFEYEDHQNDLLRILKRSGDYG